MSVEECDVSISVFRLADFQKANVVSKPQDIPDFCKLIIAMEEYICAVPISSVWPRELK